jgi:uncharacterized protein (DUF2236 family)
LAVQRTIRRVLLDLLDRPRATLARAVQARIGGDDFAAAHAQIWHTEGPRWFSATDPVWRVHADTSMFVGGIRALLLQSLHPVAMKAVSQHSGFRGDPWGRLHRTSRFLASTTYGTIADAERDIAHVRAIHARISGRTRDGRTYRADDPTLLTWVHLAEADSFLSAHQHFGATPLTEAEADRYVEQAGLVAGRLGVPEPPRSTAELAAALARYRPGLEMTAEAREAADLLLRDPPLRGPARAGYAALAAGAVSILPAWARTMLALPVLPITDRLLARPLARSGLATIRWALAGPTTA